eukprot:SAG31_NODE_2529_length_5556_cov_114.211472_6_plen_133_part_00
MQLATMCVISRPVCLSRNLAFEQVMAVLLNSSVLEEQTNRDIDFDTELKVAGVANALAGTVGGLTGFSTVPKTMMCYKMHGTYHSGVFTTLYFVAFLLIFMDVVAFVPLPVRVALLTRKTSERFQTSNFPVA